MKILVAGDYCPKERLEPIIKSKNYKSIFNNITDTIAASDYAIVNFETTLGIRNIDKPIIKQGSALCSPIEALDALKWAGFNTLTLANNHILDYGESALKRTIQKAKELGFNTVGAGKNLNEAQNILTLSCNGIKIAIINCCEHEYSIASHNSYGACPLNPINQYYKIQEAKKTHHYVIVIVHGGHEHFQLPSLRMQDNYRFFIDSGADTVINHHQHCFSGYEIYNSKPIFYGLGNFCFDEKKHVRPDLWHKGYMVELEFSEKDFSFRLLPYIQCFDKPVIEFRNKAEFETEIMQLNDIISDREKLKEAVNMYYDSSLRDMLAVLQPYDNKFLKSAYYRGYIPSLISKNKLLSMHNVLNCESHHDKILYAIQKKFDEYRNN